MIPCLRWARIGDYLGFTSVPKRPAKYRLVYEDFLSIVKRFFCCYQPSCVVSYQGWFWAFVFTKFSNFTPPFSPKKTAIYLPHPPSLVCCFGLFGSWIVPLHQYSSSKFPSFHPPPSPSSGSSFGDPLKPLHLLAIFRHAWDHAQALFQVWGGGEWSLWGYYIGILYWVFPLLLVCLFGVSDYSVCD